MSKVDISNLNLSSEVLEEVAADTLNNWGMMFTEQSSSTAISTTSTDLDGAYVSNLILNGPKECVLKVVASKDFAHNLCQNLTGESPDNYNEDELKDCLREMTNIIGGKLITLVFGENVVYDLSNLSCKNIIQDDINSFLSEDISTCLLGDDSLVGLSFSLKDQ